MVNPIASALLHNTTTRLTLGNTPLHAISLVIAQELKPLLAACSSLLYLNIHTKYIPPESLRILILGAARCKSLQQLRVVGGLSILQAKMIMPALTHFTFIKNKNNNNNNKTSRAASAVHNNNNNCNNNNKRRFNNSPARNCFYSPIDEDIKDKKNEIIKRKYNNIMRENNEYNINLRQHYRREREYKRLHSHQSSYEVKNINALNSPRITWMNGVHIILDLHHLDDIGANFILKGLEQSERVTGLNIHITPNSQLAERTVARVLSQASFIITRNSKHVNHVLSQNNNNDNNNNNNNYIRHHYVDMKMIAVPREPSSTDSHTLPPRRYSPPRLLSEIPHLSNNNHLTNNNYLTNNNHLTNIPILSEIPLEPSSPPPFPPRFNPRRHFFSSDDAEIQNNNNNKNNNNNNNNNKDNCCFLCCEEEPLVLLNTPKQNYCIPNHNNNNNIIYSSQEPTPRDPLSATQPSPSVPMQESPITPITPISIPSLQGQRIQQLRYLRSCVHDVNSVIVQFQVINRETVRRLEAEMRVLEEQLTEKVTTKLTDMMISISEMEKIEIKSPLD